MKVVCVAHRVVSLEYGKWYDVLNQDSTHYLIDDDYEDVYYPKHFFKTEAEVMDEKLNELGIM